MEQTTLTESIRQKYGDAARGVRATGAKASCCGDGGACCGDPISSDLYDAAQSSELPEQALKASLGCGNPTALAELRAGETVLDLGSGGGIDVLLSARRVGPTGKAFGLDTTDEMLALAEDNKRRSGLENVEFLRGDIERIPLPDSSVDVIISNCVINLSGDKPQVLREAFRVLKPGGRFAVSDIVFRGDMPEALRRDRDAWTACVGGALDEQEYVGLLTEAGFEGAAIEVTRVFDRDDARSFLSADLAERDGMADAVGDRLISAFVRASKPSAACCGTTCCQ